MSPAACLLAHKSPEGTRLGKLHEAVELLLRQHCLTHVPQCPCGMHESTLSSQMQAHTVPPGMKAPGVLLRCMPAWSPMRSTPYGPSGDTGTWSPYGMQSDMVPCGTQAGVLGMPHRPPFHQAKC